MGRGGAQRTSDPQPGLPAAMRTIVLDALAKGVGGTLTKNSVLTREQGISAGTIQRTLDLLSEQGALQTISRGHLGRRIAALDVGLGWRTARLPPLRLVVTPAGAVEMDALESALRDSLTDLGLPYTVQHLRGGSPRLAAVRAGDHDLTVVSSGTFEGVAAAEEPGDQVRTLAPGTYYAPDRLMVVERVAGPARPAGRETVAIDRESLDHEALTLAEFPDAPGRGYIEVPFPDVPAYVAAGVVDAGVWHVTRSPVPLTFAGLRLRPLARPEARAVRDGLSRAALVAWGGRPELRAVLPELRLDGVLDDQRRGFAEEEARARRLERAAERGPDGLKT